MIITGARIRSLWKRFVGIAAGHAVILGLSQIDRFAERLRAIGFDADAGDGDTVLPSALGPVSAHNAEGTYVPQKDQPMETAYRQVEWHWEEWNGPYTVEQSKIVDVPYKRYPRIFVPPPSVELTIARDRQGNRLLITPPIEYTAENEADILHRVNLFLELFGECSVLDVRLEPIQQPALRRVNWKILPQGRMPWERLRRALKPVVEREPEGNRPVIEYRFEAVNEHAPEFVAVGVGGFDGYVIFAFPKRNLYVLESARYGNATYVFGDNWEDLSQRTKAEILDERLQKARLIHREGWDRELRALFGAGAGDRRRGRLH